MTKKINVLDKGYVRLRDVMGDDRTIANAARVSFDRRTEELSDRDERLIAFLAREGHDSPFRHASLQFEVYAPLMIAQIGRASCRGRVVISVATGTFENMDRIGKC